MLGEAFYKIFGEEYQLKCSDVDGNEPWLSHLDFRDFDAYAKDVDVLFHEALNKQMVSVMERAARANSADNLATILEDITDYHASPYEAAQTATDANAQNLVIYHLVPPLPVDSLKTLFARDMNKAFAGKITISEDGTIVRLPSGTEAIIYENGL